MKNLFWGDMEAIIKVKDNIPDENLEILRAIYPSAKFIKESSISNICYEEKSNLILEEFTFTEKTEIINETSIIFHDIEITPADFYFNPYFGELNSVVLPNDNTEHEKNFRLAA